MAAKVLLVGAGRMGLRHLGGLHAAGAEVTVVDPREEARAEAEGAYAATASLEEALEAGTYDAAVLAATAAGRLERFTAVAEVGIPRVLVEKPIEQSRGRAVALAEAAARHGVDARVNHGLRTLELFTELRRGGGPFSIGANGGAYGLACNGIHWLDLALYLSGDRGGRLLYGELDPTPIGSGRGAEFRDYGGRGLYAFPDGSRLYLSCAAESSAPASATIVQRDRHSVLLPQEHLGLLYERPEPIDLPAYRYGAGYERRDIEAFPPDLLVRGTERWARGDDGLPPIAVSVVSHELLFDLLETGGDSHFAVT